MTTTIEQIAKLARELPATELKPGGVYVMTYDVNQVGSSDARLVIEWLHDKGVPVIMLARDGNEESICFYKLKESDHADKP